MAPSNIKWHLRWFFLLPSEVQETSRSALKAKLDPHGYKLTVALQYDDLFKEEFKEEATDKADAVMEVVTEMFSRMQVILF